MNIKISTSNILVIFCILFLAGCTTSPEDKLKADLEKYIACQKNSSPCAVDFMNPNQVRKKGGRDIVLGRMKEAAKTFKISKLEVNNIGKVQGSGKSLSSMITTTVTMAINGEDMDMPSMQTFWLAESSDGGEHWFFSDQ